MRKAAPGRGVRRPFSKRRKFESLESRDLLSVVPAGFTETAVATALSSPTSMDIAPDGRVFIAQQNGTIRIVENDALLPTQFGKLTVDSSYEHGLLGITLDPNFETNHYLYVFYTATTPTSHMRVSRLTANGDTLQAGSEVVLMDFPTIAPSSIYRMGGAMHFGPDGKLYISVGDEMKSSSAQKLDNPLGKILRINSDGSIPTDNPFYNSTTGINRAIWAYGLRNPFTTAFQPGTGLFFLNDVGDASWEEIDVGQAGANYGWPTTEGNFLQSAHPNFTEAFYTYAHNNQNGTAITGGAFYDPAVAQFPSEYVGKYFFEDFSAGEIRTIDLTTKQVTVFATGASFPVNMLVSSDGALYYFSRGIGTGVPGNGTGQLFKIEYASSTAPKVTTPPANVLASVGHTATFTVSVTGSSPFTYQWLRNGVPIANSNSPTYTIQSASLADNGAKYSVTVSNSFGSVTSMAGTLSVTSIQPPTPLILPQGGPGNTYIAGQTFHFIGEGLDDQGNPLAASQLVWQVDFQHDTHAHPFIPPTGDTDSLDFTIPTIGETAPHVWFRVYLTVTDSIGLSNTTYFDILPVESQITLQTNIPGLSLTLDGEPQTVPETVTGVVNLQRTLQAPGVQTLNGKTYVFTGWSDGGAATHNISFPSSPTTYTANYVEGFATMLSSMPFVGPATNGWGPVERNLSNGQKKAGDGKLLTLNGVTYASGLGVHAPSTVIMNLGGDYNRFVSDIGIDDEVGDAGSAIFQVFGDGVKLFDSGIMTGSSPTQSIDLDVTGINQLKLIVLQSTGGNANDHADWANAQLIGPPPPTPPNFTAATNYGTGTNPHSVVSADVNGDGKLDLVVANGGSNTVSVLFGNGDGTFTAAGSYAAGKATKSVKVGDLNGDGLLDIAAVSQDSASLSVYFNNGDGIFANAITFSAPANAHDLVLADLDDNGSLDIATVGWGAKVVRVMLNNGDGTFAPATNYTVGNAPHSVVAADLNGDGSMDLAVADHASKNVAILLNKGDGTFKAATFVGVAGMPHSIRVGDLNGDGIIDLATANDTTNNVSVLYGNGNGTFAKAANYGTGQTPKGIELADINNDGRMDIITSNVATNYPKGTNPAGMTVSVLLGKTNGKYTAPINYAVGSAPFSIAVADFDGDGDLDIATANWSSNNVSVLLQF